MLRLALLSNLVSSGPVSVGLRQYSRMRVILLHKKRKPSHNPAGVVGALRSPRQKKEHSQQLHAAKQSFVYLSSKVLKSTNQIVLLEAAR